MYNNSFDHMDNFMGQDLFGIGVPLAAFTILPALVWTLVWKGWALWLAARRGETPWFIALLLINTVGLLEIFYIFVVAKQKDFVDEPVVVIKDSDAE